MWGLVLRLPDLSVCDCNRGQTDSRASVCEGSLLQATRQAPFLELRSWGLVTDEQNDWRTGIARWC